MSKLKNKIAVMNNGISNFFKVYLVDLFILIGLLLIIAGVFLVFGLGICLIIGGILTILFTIFDVHDIKGRS